MQTKNLKELKKLISPNFVMGAKPGMIYHKKKKLSSRPGTSKYYSEEEVADRLLEKTPRLVLYGYNKAIHCYRKEINRISLALYNRTLQYPENKTSEIYKEFKDLIDLTTSPEELVKDIKDYIGQNFTLFRKHNNSFIPVSPIRLKRAWFAIQEKRRVSLVKTILYK